MSFKEQLSQKKIPNKEDIDRLAEEIKSDVEAIFAPLQEEDIGWVTPVDDPDMKVCDKRTTRYDFLETLTQAAREGIYDFIGDDDSLKKSDLLMGFHEIGHGQITQYGAVNHSLENAISKIIHSPEFSENIAREIAKQQLYRGNDELVELERKVVDLRADLDDQFDEYVEVISNLIDSLPPEKGAFVEAIARDYEYVSRKELQDWYREETREYDEHSLED